MISRRQRQLGILACFPLVIYLSIQVVHWARWREHADSKSGVSAELYLVNPVIKNGEAPVLSVVLTNRGNKDVILVEPGDGSERGWRTPIIEWSTDPWFSSPRCGNMNPLKPEEVFVLKPGEQKRLCDWVGVSEFQSVGRYRLAVRYTNDPQKSWRDPPSDEQTRQAHQSVQGSTRITAVSNSVELLVEE